MSFDFEYLQPDHRWKPISLVRKLLYAYLMRFLSTFKKGLVSSFHFIWIFLISAFSMNAVNAQNFDTTSNHQLRSAFRQSNLSGRARYFLMFTDNEKNLTDYHANALGLNLEFETGNFYGFRLNVAGSYVANLGSSDLSKPDPLTHTYSRYEAGLFNQANLDQEQNFARLEKLNLSWSSRHWILTAGLHPLQTAFINPQDGRMETTMVGGLTAKGRCGKRNMNWQLGWLGWISPRGTQHWYSAENSIGIFGQGKNPDGQPGNYKNNSNSSGILYAEFSKKIKNLKISFTEQLVTDIFNSALLQLDYQYKTKNVNWQAAVMGIQQFSVNHGGNIDPDKTYFSPGQQTWAYGARIGAAIKKTELFLNYTRITKNGRYLMPREWGRDPFFTFIPRERADGLADADAVSINLKQELLKSRLSFELAYGRYYLPSPTETHKNKYGMPSYDHSKLQVNYSFAKALKGLSFSALLIYKSAIDTKPADPKFIINRVNTGNYNFVLNYQFHHAYK